MKRKAKWIAAGAVVGVLAVGAVIVNKYISIQKTDDTITVIGGSDGPTSVFLAGKLSGGNAQPEISEESESQPETEETPVSEPETPQPQETESVTEDVQKDAEDSDVEPAESETSEQQPKTPKTEEASAADEFYVSEIPDDIFEKLYEADYPIEKIRLVDEYDADDEASMSDNNSSAFNFRFISHTTKISKHGLGMAVDINTLYNPYVKTVDGKRSVEPANASDYVDRSADFPYKIDHDDLCYRLFKEHGFSWGGDWQHSKDYQHFEKNL